ncbi:hypothetical protein F5B18DRAFT_660133 [Nemania serpens]|nr:hypothetical protein F5B18DRAFT_660133 [Nemania serpens]
MAPGGHGENRGPVAVAAAQPLLPPTPGSVSYAHHDEEHAGSRNKKRAKSIDIDEANQSSIARLGLYTPATARNDEPRELICLCAKAPKVPRPRNAFILYRQAWQGHFAAQHPGLANPEISKLIGEKWREQPESVKNQWKQLAEEEKIRHQRQYPGYRYQPRRGGKNGSGRPTSSIGETPGRCPKCGGRYIATPRTPTTPFSVASPPLSKRLPNMQPYMNAEHPRHGSISSSSMPAENHARRYTHTQFREVEEDYPIMSPLAAPPLGVPPEAKRRRFNGAPVYVPRSPHMGYAPVDPRYQHRPSVSGPPVSATGYLSPGHLPRPPMQQHRQGMYSHPNHPHMQPPLQPRQSMSYPALPTTPNRPNGGFDETLRLPPLQSQIHESSAMGPEPSARQAMAPAQAHQAPGTGLGIVNPGSAVRQAQQSHHPHPHPHPHSHPHSNPQSSPRLVPQIFPFMLKLDVLRGLSSPLLPPGQGGPHYETRGPIIAVEGAPTPMLKEVSAVIERALSASAEFAVKVWSEDTSTAIAHSSPEPHGTPDGGAVAAAQQKKTSAPISPVVSFLARMLKWHKTSEDLVRYITSYPPTPSGDGDRGATTTTTGTSDRGPDSNNATSSHRLPIALLSDGYSFTFSDRYASALHVNDNYHFDDHWQWVATLWRGIVGADLIVYINRTPEEAQGQGQQAQGGGGGGENGSSANSNNNNNGNGNGNANTAANANGNGSSNFEIIGPGLMVIRIPEGGHMDEKLERRFSFEIAEWVRAGSYMDGFGKP